MTREHKHELISQVFNMTVTCDNCGRLDCSCEVCGIGSGPKQLSSDLNLVALIERQVAERGLSSMYMRIRFDMLWPGQDYDASDLDGFDIFRIDRMTAAERVDALVTLIQEQQLCRNE